MRELVAENLIGFHLPYISFGDRQHPRGEPSNWHKPVLPSNLFLSYYFFIGRRTFNVRYITHMRGGITAARPGLPIDLIVSTRMIRGRKRLFDIAGLGLQRHKEGLRMWLDSGVGAILDW